MSKLTNLKKAIEKIMLTSPLSFESRHSKMTLRWLLELKPNADEALQIAALAHDIERPITGITETYGLKNLDNIEEFKKEHAKRSAKFIGDLMRMHGYNEDIIDRTTYLVAKHEEGGDEDADLLMNSDSIAFFDHVDICLQLNGRNKTKDKIRFMYSRMSDRGKEIAKNMKFKKEIREILDEVIKEN